MMMCIQNLINSPNVFIPENDRALQCITVITTSVYRCHCNFTVAF